MAWGDSTFGSGTWGTTFAEIAVTGLAGTASVGDESLFTQNIIAVTGLSATISQGTALGQGGVIVSVTGVSATGYAGEEHLWSDFDTSQTPSWSEITTTQTPSWGDILTP